VSVLQLLDPVLFSTLATIKTRLTHLEWMLLSLSFSLFLPPSLPLSLSPSLSLSLSLSPSLLPSLLSYGGYFYSFVLRKRVQIKFRPISISRGPEQQLKPNLLLLDSALTPGSSAGPVWTSLVLQLKRSPRSNSSGDLSLANGQAPYGSFGLRLPSMATHILKYKN